MARSAQSGTLTANTPTEVNVANAFPGINVLNRGQSGTVTGTIWVTLDGTVPTVGGANCFPVLGARFFPVKQTHDQTVAVKLISTAALDWTVEGDPGGTE